LDEVDIWLEVRADMKEKSLSEKQIITINKIMIASSKGDLDEVGRLFFEIQENDAEAVRRLKDWSKILVNDLEAINLLQIIDEIFGDKLV